MALFSLYFLVLCPEREGIIESAWSLSLAQIRQEGVEWDSFLSSMVSWLSTILKLHLLPPDAPATFYLVYFHASMSMFLRLPQPRTPFIICLELSYLV